MSTASNTHSRAIHSAIANFSRQASHSTPPTTILSPSHPLPPTIHQPSTSHLTSNMCCLSSCICCIHHQSDTTPLLLPSTQVPIFEPATTTPRYPRIPLTCKRNARVLHSTHYHCISTSAAPQPSHVSSGHSRPSLHVVCFPYSVSILKENRNPLVPVLTVVSIPFSLAQSINVTLAPYRLLSCRIFHSY